MHAILCVILALVTQMVAYVIVNISYNDFFCKILNLYPHIV